MSDRTQSIQKQISEIEEHLNLVEERKSQYVSTTAIPLDLIRDEQRLREKKESLESELRSFSSAPSHETAKLRGIGSRKSVAFKFGITTMAVLIPVAIGFFVWSHSTDKPDARERTLSYWALAQKYKNDRRDGEPIRLIGSQMYFNTGDELQFFITSSDSGHLYLLSEEIKDGSPLFQLLFPTPKVNNSSSQIQANSEVATERGFFDKNVGSEQIWIIWSASSIPELESEISSWKDKDYLGEITEPTRVGLIHKVIEESSKDRVHVEQDDSNSRMNITGRGIVIVRLVTLAHR